MKTLILTVTIGEGHNALARSLSEKFKNYGECEIFDIFAFSKFIKNINAKGYLFLIKHFPKVYDYFWNKERQKKGHGTEEKGSAYLSVKKAIKFVKEKIDCFKPDVIISVHNYASNIVSYIKNRQKTDFLSGTVVFDYCLCPYWEASVKNDFVFSPAKFLEEDLIKVGFKKEQICNFGFPTNPKFELEYNKEELREKLGFKKKDFVVLSMTGGFGQGSQLKLLKNLGANGINKNVKFVLICGRNEKQFNACTKYINKNKIKNFTVCGFVNNIEEYMQISDVTFARGSGNNLTECFHSGLVPIIRENMVTNEEINKQLFLKNNLAFGLNKIEEASIIVNKLSENRKLIYEKQENIKSFVVSSSAEKIANKMFEEFSKK